VFFYFVFLLNKYLCEGKYDYTADQER